MSIVSVEPGFIAVVTVKDEKCLLRISTILSVHCLGDKGSVIFSNRGEYAAETKVKNSIEDIERLLRGKN